MKYKVGDKVTIRSWEAMEREFGLNKNDSIDLLKGIFIKKMREYCGRQLTIKYVCNNYYILDEGCRAWSWIDEMIAHNFTFGEEIEVRCRERNEWGKRIFVGYIDGSLDPYICVDVDYEQNFKDSKPYRTVPWLHVRKIQKPKLTAKDWLDKYYPYPADQVKTAKEALEHSIRKWEGLYPDVLKDYGLEWDENFVFVNQWNILGSSSCACCRYFRFKNNGGCYSCIDFCYKNDSSYKLSMKENNPDYVLKALRERLQKETKSLSGKTVKVTLDGVEYEAEIK